MLSLFDTPSLERALALPLDPKLRRLLSSRVEHLNALEFDVRELTYFLVITADATLEDVVDELGWSPLVSPLDGAAYGTDGFHPYHDYCTDHGGWFEMIVSAGNDAAFVLLVEDRDGTDSDLLGLCRTYAE